MRDTSLSAENAVRAAIERWSGPQVDVAYELCDRHPRQGVAFTVVDGDVDREVTYGELRQFSRRCAAGLRDLGVGPGDRVATLMGKSVELIGVMLATWRLGAVYVPLFTAFAVPAVEVRLRRSRASVVVVDPDQRAKLDDLPADLAEHCRVVVAGETGDGLVTLDQLTDRPGPEKPVPSTAVGGAGAMAHLFTSGTTGAAKSVVHSPAFLAGWDIYFEYAMGVDPDETYWCAADPGWGYGLYAGIIGPLSLGLHAVLVRGGFDVELTLQVLARLRVSTVAGAPTMYRAMRASRATVPDDLALVRAASAGEPLTSEVNAWAREALGVEVFDHFGQTEIGMPLANHQHPDLARAVRPGSTGVATPGWRLAILRDEADIEAPAGEIGRLAVDVPASPLMTFPGYEQPTGGAADPFTADRRWYLTGDAASRDDTGAFFFSARHDDVIIAAGYRIGPFDIESVIAQHPAVAECAVVSAPDAIRGEVVEAFVVTRGEEHDEHELTDTLQQLVRTTYGAHAYPRRVHYRDQLPKTPSGKIQRFALRAELRRPSSGSDAARSTIDG